MVQATNSRSLPQCDHPDFQWSPKDISIAGAQDHRPKLYPGASLKRCSHCKSSYPPDTDHFQRDRHSPDSLTSQCKECRSIKRKERYQRASAMGIKENGHEYAKRRLALAQKQGDRTVSPNENPVLKQSNILAPVRSGRA